MIKSVLPKEKKMNFHFLFFSFPFFCYLHLIKDPTFSTFSLICLSSILCNYQLSINSGYHLAAISTICTNVSCIYMRLLKRERFASDVHAFRQERELISANMWAFSLCGDVIFRRSCTVVDHIQHQEGEGLLR